MTSFAIKIVALITMIIDHTAVVFNLPTFLRMIGRIAFPLFAFCTSEGAKHTHNINEYTINLGIFALISEIPFDIAFNGGISGINFFQDTNIFYTLFLSVLAINIYERLSNDTKYKYIIACACVLPAMAVSCFLETDYSYKGVALIFLLYICEKRNTQLLVLAAFAIIEYYYLPLFALFALIPVVLVYAYNGKRGYNLKWFFYWVYPIHLTILSILNSLIY